MIANRTELTIPDMRGEITHDAAITEKK